ncbi:hypothetical protein VPH35_126094 [Triticum aestivum]
MAARWLPSPEQRAMDRVPRAPPASVAPTSRTRRLCGGRDISPATAGAGVRRRRRRARRGGQATRACVSAAAAAAASFHAPPRRAEASWPWRARTATAVRTPKAGVIWDGLASRLCLRHKTPGLHDAREGDEA